MGSRSGTGYRDLIGIPSKPSETKLMTKQMGNLNSYLKKEEGKKTIETSLTIISMSNPALNQLYLSYRISKLAYNYYLTYKKEGLKKAIQNASKDSMPFLIGSVAGHIVDNQLSNILYQEKVPLSPNQINLIKSSAKMALMQTIKKEIGG